MKICPVCKKEYDDVELICPDCYTRQNLPERKGYFDFTINFFYRNSNLFTIIGLISTFLSIFPLFLPFMFGENWLNNLIGDPTIGFDCLILILAATIFGAASVYYISCLIFIDFINCIRKTNDLHIGEILFSASILLIVFACIFCLDGFLVLIWFSKHDLIIGLYGLILVLIALTPAIIIVISGILQMYPKNCLTSLKKNPITKSDISKIIFSIGLTIALLIMLFFLVFYWIIPISNNLSTINTEVSKYYLDKKVNVDIRSNIVNKTNTTPAQLNISYFVDPYFTQGWTDFDRIYSQCHWSTNYGYFLTISSNNSLVRKESQEFIIPGCTSPPDKIYWTYDIEDFGRNKSPVLIGLIVEDRNKKTNNTLGYDRILLNWNGTDMIEVEKNVTNIQSAM